MKKSSVSMVLKHIISVLSSIAKAKTMAIKTKTVAVKDRLVMLSLLKSRKLPLSAMISHKIHAIMGHATPNEQSSKAIVLYNDDDGGGSGDDKYPDLRHSLFDDGDDDDDDPNGSVIDLVRNSKEEEGRNFSLEDEIDHVADLFIIKFHKRMRLQKLESFKRYQDMLERSA